MSSAESPHNSHLLFIGQQCHSPQCYMVDFLPFTCEHCKFAFCADHYRPAEHSCDKFDTAKHDRVAPPCPLCSTPVAIPPNQDPNVYMERHMEDDCGKRTRPGSMPVCARGRCGKRLFAPIKCNSCGEQFCAAHRFPSTHACSSATTKPAETARSKLANQTSVVSAAAMAAIKRNVTNTKAPTKAAEIWNRAPVNPAKQPTLTSGAPAPKPGSVSKHKNPFSKADRRAKAEQESRLRGMRERAKRGLLSEKEQDLLAEEEAALAAGPNKKDSDCVIM